MWVLLQAAADEGVSSADLGRFLIYAGGAFIVLGLILAAAMKGNGPFIWVAGFGLVLVLIGYAISNEE